MIKFYQFFILIALCACGPQITSLQNDDELALLPLYETRPSADSRIEFNKVSVPFQTGDWKSIGEVTFKPVQGFPQRQKIFISETEGIIDRAVAVWTQSRPGSGTFTRFRHCKNETYLHSVVFANGRNANKCWHLRAVNLGLSGEPPELNLKLAQYAEANDLFLSATMIGARFIVSQGLRRYYIEYMWSPDVILPKGDGQVWLPADWMRDAVEEDFQRAAVADGLIEWGTHWQSVIFLQRAMFRKYAADS